MLLSELLATSKQLRVTTMAFDRMKALETYLQSCKDLPNFTEILEQQAVMLVKEIRNLGKLGAFVGFGSTKYSMDEGFEGDHSKKYPAQSARIHAKAGYRAPSDERA